ncbi:MAG: helix-turn-helix transcriptional regulator [Coriobacteriales bacterium]
METKRLGFMQLTVVVGFCLYYGYYLVAFFGAFIELPVGADFVAAHLGQAAFFLGSIVGTQALLLWFRHRNSVALGHTRFFFLASLIPGSISPLLIVLDALAVPLPLPLAYGGLLCAGVSIAMGFMLWDDFTVHGGLCHNQFAHAVIFCIGGVLFIACTALLPKLALGIVCELMLVCSMLLVMFITPRRRPVPDKQASPAAEFFRGTVHLDIVSAVLNVAFGFAFILLYQAGGVAVLGAGAAAILMDAAVSALMGNRRTLLFSGALRLFAAVVSCALLLSLAPSQGVQVLALGAVVVYWFLFRTIHCGCLAALAASNEFSVLYTSTRGKLAANIGFACGLLLGTLVAYLAAASATLYLTLAVVAAFILASLFFLPFNQEVETPGYRTITFAAQPPAITRESTIEERCAKLAKRYKLSPRETEVLSYAAQGRNAKAIAEKLFISESTTKTHLSNLYRQANVHSQQELLSLLDQI